jgi:hypothetical protein
MSQLILKCFVRHAILVHYCFALFLPLIILRRHMATIIISASIIIIIVKWTHVFS